MVEMKISSASNVFFLPCVKEEGVAFTTNGITRADGSAVCGAGQALEAQKLFNVEKKLGNYITQYGNRAFYLGTYAQKKDEEVIREFSLLTFPTKHHWKDKSDIQLIEKSCHELMDIADKFGLTRIFFAPPGCGLGQLNYNCQVAPVIKSILDDRFVVVFREKVR